MTDREEARWREDNALLQSYRQGMVISQSLLLTAAAVCWGRSRALCLAFTAVGLVQLWYVWLPVIRARALVSDYHKFNLFYDLSRRVNRQGEVLSGAEAGLTEEDYVHRPDVRRRANGTLAELTGLERLRTNRRATRRKLDGVIPASFTVLWAALAVLSALGR